MMPPVSERPAAPPTQRQLLEDQVLLSDLRRYLSGRLPRGEVDDVLQTTLTAALESDGAPTEPEEFRRWIHGVARNKAADHFRRRGREPLLYDDAPDQAAPETADGDAKELMHWALRELPEGDQSEDTLEWMLREGAGEKLETIANEHNLPAPRVRQRVSRLRRYFRTRWAAAAAVLAFAILAGFWLAETREPPRVVIAPETDAAAPRAEDIRKEAQRACDAAQWRRCLTLYDDAKALDQEGDALPAVQAQRKRAHEAIQREAPLPPPGPPTKSVAPTPLDGKTPPLEPAPTGTPTPRPTPKPQPAPTPQDTRSKTQDTKSKDVKAPAPAPQKSKNSWEGDFGAQQKK